MWQISRKGFTLLEMIVAMTILSVIVAALYTSFKGGTDSWTKGRIMSEMTQNARITLEIMSREISSAIISPYTDLDDTNIVQDMVFIGKDNGNSDTLDFTAMLRSPDSSEKYEFGLVEIGYSHDSTDKKIQRRIDPTAIWDGAGSADANPLGPTTSYDDLAYNVTALNFEYWDCVNSVYRSDWDTRLDNELDSGGNPTITNAVDYVDYDYDDNKLPGAVKITITVVDDPDPTKTKISKEYSTVVYLPGSKVF